MKEKPKPAFNDPPKSKKNEPSSDSSESPLESEDSESEAGLRDAGDTAWMSMLSDDFGNWHTHTNTHTVESIYLYTHGML